MRLSVVHKFNLERFKDLIFLNYLYLDECCSIYADTNHADIAINPRIFSAVEDQTWTRGPVNS